MRQPNIQLFIFVYSSVSKYEITEYTSFHLSLYILLSEYESAKHTSIHLSLYIHLALNMRQLRQLPLTLPLTFSINICLLTPGPFCIWLSRLALYYFVYIWLSQSWRRSDVKAVTLCFGFPTFLYLSVFFRSYLSVSRNHVYYSVSINIFSWVNWDENPPWLPSLYVKPLRRWGVWLRRNAVSKTWKSVSCLHRIVWWFWQ